MCRKHDPRSTVEAQENLARLVLGAELLVYLVEEEKDIYIGQVSCAT